MGRRWSAPLGLALVILAGTTAAAAAVHLNETGSTLLYPVMVRWIQLYGAQHKGTMIAAAPTGSGVGIRAAITGDAQIGASDAYLTDAQRNGGTLENIPLAVSAQEIVYNVPELHGGPPLRLSGAILAGIYDGTIGWWDDGPIAAANPGRALPHHAILPVHRSDASGDTFLFTQYVSRASPAWDRTVHFDTDVRWPPNRRALSGGGNGGVIEIAADARYSVAYIGSSYAARAQAARLDVAALENHDGDFVRPSPEGIEAAVRAVEPGVPADGRASLVFVAGAAAYPIVNFEYAIVKTTQKGRGRAAALRGFLQWVVAPEAGNAPGLLAEVHFLPLPARVRTIAQQQIGAITGP